MQPLPDKKNSVEQKLAVLEELSNEEEIGPAATREESTEDGV